MEEEKKEVTEGKGWNVFKLLPSCGKEAANLDIIFACDGASSVGQVANEVAKDLTMRGVGARMCCTAAVGAGSEAHVNIGKNAKRVIVINGCANKCTSKIMQQKGIKIDYEYTISEMNVKKAPTLDFDEKDVEKIAEKIAEDVGYNGKA
ncbi:MAG: putative zinc-binding protein [Caldisericum sp.]